MAQLQHEYVGTEHILLGMIAEGKGVGVTVLQNLGINADELRQIIISTGSGDESLLGRDRASPARATRGDRAAVPATPIRERPGSLKPLSYTVEIA
ncbi:MAG: Clp protease N-terminal domain-containing protein [Gemmatimonadaceae bacterium]